MRKCIMTLALTLILVMSVPVIGFAESIEIEIEIGTGDGGGNNGNSGSTEIEIIYPQPAPKPPVQSQPDVQQPAESSEVSTEQEGSAESSEEETAPVLPVTTLLGKSAGSLTLTESCIIFAPLIELQNLDMNIDTVYSQSVLEELNVN